MFLIKLLSYCNRSHVYIALIACLLTLFMVQSCKRTDNNNKTQKQEINQEAHTVKQDTTVEIKQKKNNSEPDIKVKTTYVAEVNGSTVAVPVKNINKPTTTTVSTQVDLTPIIKKLEPNWEIGIGVGFNGKEFPVSIQRNYKPNRAIEFIGIVDNKGKFSKGYVTHKWSF